MLLSDLLWWRLPGAVTEDAALKPLEMPPSGISMTQAGDTNGGVSPCFPEVKPGGVLCCPASSEGLKVPSPGEIGRVAPISFWESCFSVAEIAHRVGDALVSLHICPLPS